MSHLQNDPNNLHYSLLFCSNNNVLGDNKEFMWVSASTPSHTELSIACLNSGTLIWVIPCDISEESTSVTPGPKEVTVSDTLPLSPVQEKGPSCSEFFFWLKEVALSLCSLKLPTLDSVISWSPPLLGKMISWSPPITWLVICLSLSNFSLLKAPLQHQVY